jgi:cyclic pyranopterin monophosphate synthase
VSDPRLTHLDAAARAAVRCDRPTYDLVAAGEAAKGDVLGVARVAGIMAAKRTPDLIPLCHPLALTSVEVSVSLDPALPGVRIEATARCTGPTGVEMEALTAAAVAALTVVDMAKASDRWMAVEGLGLVAKSGGRSGPVTRPADRAL